MPEALLIEGFRRAVLEFLVRHAAISGELRAPMSLEKMTYDAATGTVIYRSKMHLGLKRNFQVMPGAQWLELLCRHIPDRYEHLVRYVGWYSNRARGERAKTQKGQNAPATCVSPIEPVSEFAARAKSAWARLIRKVYEADPLECPKCHGPMRILALINDPLVVRRILEHLGLWQPEATERSPPVPPEAWPLRSSYIQPECGLLRGFEVAGIVKRVVTGANYPRTRCRKLAVGLMQAAAGESAGKECD